MVVESSAINNITSVKAQGTTQREDKMKVTVKLKKSYVLLSCEHDTANAIMFQKRQGNISFIYLNFLS